MAPTLPRTIRAVDTEQLLDLEREAGAYGFSQQLPVDWLRDHLAPGATHYLSPALVHHLSHRPEVSPQWRCELLLTAPSGEQFLSLLDMLPATFGKLPETLDATVKTDIASRMERAPAQREWAEAVGRLPKPTLKKCHDPEIPDTHMG
ncbi:hypothetical protein [Streptomyces sp. H27-C3]|uniref:hypothetical protein n=1 Tax=Streptomyces sp. H27-C3 TaxID=3046305 RepID=UPI0024B88732|nr:hypothetical protein [Streptomyces sp. H27-C3]MDJ0466278.1 hypothetical protein [Streptomyces sp. H27-C3]